MLESDSKALWKKEVLKSKRFKKVFYIETEETEPGFPDCLCEDFSGKFHLFEHKATKGPRNVFKYQKTQPAWYIRNREIVVGLVVYDNKRKDFVEYESAFIVATTMTNSSLEVPL